MVFAVVAAEEHGLVETSLDVSAERTVVRPYPLFETDSRVVALSHNNKRIIRILNLSSCTTMSADRTMSYGMKNADASCGFSVRRGSVSAL